MLCSGSQRQVSQASDDRRSYGTNIMRRLHARQFRTVPGRNYDTPKELWGFESDHDGGTAQETAETFLHRHADLLGIEREIETLRPRRRIESLGAGHVILEQRFRDLRIHRAYVTAHVRHAGGVYLVKNRAVPEDVLMRARAGSIGAQRAVLIARRALRRSGARLHVIGEPEQLWYPARRLLHPA